MIYKEKIKIFCILYVFTREIKYVYKGNKNRNNGIMNLKNKEGKTIDNKKKIYIKNLHLCDISCDISGDYFYLNLLIFFC